MNESVLSVKMDADVKKGFGETCATLGMSVADAVNMFAKVVMLEKRIPFKYEIFDEPIVNGNKSGMEQEEAVHSAEREKEVDEWLRSITGIIPAFEGDYKEMMAKWRYEDYENLV